MITLPELPDVLQKLVSLGQRQNIDISPVLLRIVTDLYAARETRSAEATQEYENVALHLLERADEATILSIARRLAPLADAPRRVLDWILGRGGAPALALLQQAPSLARDRLYDFADHGPRELALAVAARADLDAALVSALATRPERDVLLALATNPGVAFDIPTYRRLAALARRDRELAGALAERAPDPEEAAPLFLHAGSAVRAEILRRMRVADVLASRRDLDRQPDEAMAPEIEVLALAGKRSQIVDKLAGEIGCTRGEIEAVLADPSGEAVAVLLSAVGITAPVAGRIIMSGTLMVPSSVRQVHELVATVAGLSQRAARRLVGAMTGQQTEPRRATHVPVYESGSPVRPRAASRDGSWNGIERRRSDNSRKLGGD